MTMPKHKIAIYTLDSCIYCKKALMFLCEHGLEFQQHRIDGNEDMMFKMLSERYNIKGDVTVPQIIVDGERIGGYTDMMALVEKGEFPPKPRGEFEFK